MVLLKAHASARRHAISWMAYRLRRWRVFV
jgi:hypothetical protein